MKNLFTSLAFLLLLCGPALGQADADYAQALRKLMQVSGAEGTYTVVVTQMMGTFREMFGDETNAELFDNLEKEMLELAVEELAEMLVPVYQKHLTKADLEGLVAFYETPLGRKYAERTPAITQESMLVGQEWGKKIGEMVYERLQDK